MALCKTHLSHGGYNSTAALTPQSSITDDDSPNFKKYAQKSCSQSMESKGLEADRPIGYGAFGVVW